MSDEEQQPTAEAAETSPPTGETQQQAPRVEIDESGAACSYANFCRVTGTPEELIIDFGLNSQPYGTPTEVYAERNGPMKCREEKRDEKFLRENGRVLVINM